MDKDIGFYEELLFKIGKYITKSKVYLHAELISDIKTLKECEDGKRILSDSEWKGLYEKTKTNKEFAEIFFSSPALPKSIITEDIKNNLKNIIYNYHTVITNIIPKLSHEEFETLLTTNKLALVSCVGYCSPNTYEIFTQEQRNSIANWYFDDSIYSDKYKSLSILQFVTDLNLIKKLIDKEEDAIFQNNNISYTEVQFLKTMIANSYVLPDSVKNEYDISEIMISELENPTPQTFDDAYKSVMLSNDQKFKEKFLFSAIHKGFLTEPYQIDAMNHFVNEKDKKENPFISRFIDEVKSPEVLEIASKLPTINRKTVYYNPHCPAVIHEKRIADICKTFKNNIKNNKHFSHKNIEDVRHSIEFTALDNDTYDTLLKVTDKELDLAYSIIRSPYTPKSILEKLEIQTRKNINNEDFNLYGKQESENLNYFVNFKLNAMKKQLADIDKVCTAFYICRYLNEYTKEDLFKSIARNPNINEYTKLMRQLMPKNCNDRLKNYLDEFKKRLDEVRIIETPLTKEALSKLTTDEFDIFTNNYRNSLHLSLAFGKQAYYEVIEKMDELLNIIEVAEEKSKLKAKFESIGR